ncbi:unnamed protein product [Calypogeia fissa]
MGLAVVPNGRNPTKSSSRKKTAPEVPTKCCGPAQQQKKAAATTKASSRKGWTLFILKQHVPENSPIESPKKKNHHAHTANFPCQSCGTDNKQKQLQLQHHLQAPTSPPSFDDCSVPTTGDEKVQEEENISITNKERARGLSAIVQDVLSRSRSSELRRQNSTKSQEGDRSSAKVVGVESIAVAKNVVAVAPRKIKDSTSTPETSLSFRMRLVDRCDTDLGVVASLRNGPRRVPTASAIGPGCEASQSCRYPLQRPGEGAASIVDLLERGKRLGIEDNSRVLTTRSSTTDEYECVVKRLRDARGTIRLLAATAIREATRNSPQARDDLWRAGAIPPLVTLLQEEDMGICYMATVALLNLAIGSVRNKQQMADCGCIPILVRLMRPESTTTVRESATTVILSLAASDQLKPGIGASGAIIYLSDILTNGTTQGRSDAVRALLNLSIYKGNRAIIAQAGVVSPLYKVILRDEKEVAEKAVILLSHLFHDREGKETITAEEHSCSVLLQILKRGTFSQTCKEQTVIILLALSAKMAVRREAVFAQGILPCLVEMALIGSNTKIQDKAAKLLRIIKEQRLDQGILSMDRVSGVDIETRITLERQYSSSSTADTSITIPVQSRRRVTRSVSNLSGKEVQLASKGSKEGLKSLNYFRSLFGRSLRSEYFTCRTVSIDETSRIPVKLVRSFCSQG